MESDGGVGGPMSFIGIVTKFNVSPPQGLEDDLCDLEVDLCDLETGAPRVGAGQWPASPALGL